MEKLQILMNDIAEWSNATFGGQNSVSKLHHLKKEVPELIEAIEDYEKHGDTFSLDATNMEFADCMMLLLDAATHCGLTAEMLFYYVEEKLEINKKRKWGVPDKNGVVEHIPS